MRIAALLALSLSAATATAADVSAYYVGTQSTAIQRHGQTWVDKSGNDSTGKRGDPSKPFLTIPRALSVSIPGDVVHLGVGEFPASPPITVPKGVILRGVSESASIISSANEARLGPSLVPSDNCTIENVCVRIAPGYYQTPSYPIGVHSDAGRASTNVTIRNCIIQGQTDTVILVCPVPCRWRFERCRFESKGDLVVMHNHNDGELRFVESSFLVHGPLPGATSVRTLLLSFGSVIYDRCSIVATNFGPMATGAQLIGPRSSVVYENSTLQVYSTGSVQRIVSNSQIPVTER